MAIAFDDLAFVQPHPRVAALLQDLQAWAKTQGLSQKRLAEHLGVSRQRLHQWMHGALPNGEAVLQVEAFLRKARRRTRLALKEPGVPRRHKKKRRRRQSSSLLFRSYI